MNSIGHWCQQVLIIIANLFLELKRQHVTKFYQKEIEGLPMDKRQLENLLGIEYIIYMTIGIYGFLNMMKMLEATYLLILKYPQCV